MIEYMMLYDWNYYQDYENFDKDTLIGLLEYGIDKYDYAESEMDDLIVDLEDKLSNVISFVVVGELGTWRGKFEVCSNEIGTVEKAIKKCFEDYNSIYIENGDLKVKAIHHDGTNYFCIREYSEDGEHKKLFENREF